MLYNFGNFFIINVNYQIINSSKAFKKAQEDEYIIEKEWKIIRKKFNVL